MSIRLDTLSRDLLETGALARRAAAGRLRSLERFAGPRWQRLRRRGARPQRLLWASTAPKDRSSRDVRSGLDLIAPGVVTTMPLGTLQAFAGHGAVRASRSGDPARARRPRRRRRRGGSAWDRVGR